MFSIGTSLLKMLINDLRGLFKGLWWSGSNVVKICGDLILLAIWVVVLAGVWALGVVLLVVLTAGWLLGMTLLTLWCGVVERRFQLYIQRRRKRIREHRAPAPA